MRFIIHAGMGKTGTTALQRSLAASYHALRDIGVLYPISGRYSPTSLNHWALFIALLDQGHRIHEPSPAPTPRCTFVEYLGEIAEEAVASNATHIVLSCEAIWNPGSFSREVLARIAEALRTHETSILVSLRDPISHAESAYRQKVKGPQRFCARPAEMIASFVARGEYAYKDRLLELEAAFGKGSIYAYWYDEARSTVPLLGLLPAAAREVISPMRDENVSPTWSETMLFRWRNRMTRRLAVPKTPVDAVAALIHRSKVLRRLDAHRSYPVTAAYLAKLTEVAREERDAIKMDCDRNWWRSP